MDETCWTLVEGAAQGEPRAREAFARCYLPVVETYLRARWARTSLGASVDDAAQDVFVDFIRPKGALTRAQRDHGNGGFRAFLYGVARNVARRHEAGRRRRDGKEQSLPLTASFPADDERPAEAFDRAWAKAIMRAARELHAADASKQGEEAVEEVELLRLRFQRGLPIREIAARWGREPAAIHRLYGRARRAYTEALHQTVALQMPGTPVSIRQECRRLLDLLG
jgi:RNA polymerase sigma factor (sigma-70 family)